MTSNSQVDASGSQPALANLFTADDVLTLLRERGWLIALKAEGEADSALRIWLARAAELLGPQAANRAELAGLLESIFLYDAALSLQDPANQDALARAGAREVIRELANRILDTGDLDSDRFKEIIESMKQAVPYRSRAMFHPIRIALTGRVGEGELDRVILLVDSAAKLNFAVPVKTARQRMLEFCSALD
jgi:hypothetical protein